MVQPGVAHALLTEFGTLLCWDAAGQRLLHRPPGQLGGLPLVYWRRTDRDELAAEIDGRLAPIDPATGGPMRPIPADQLRAVSAAGVNQVAFDLGGGGFLSARHGGSIGRVAAAEAWESFVVLSPPAVRDLLQLACHHWIVRAQTHPTPPGSATIGRRDAFRLAERDYALPFNLPVAEAIRCESGLLSTGLLRRDGWKTDEIVRFDPLIAFVLFGGGAWAEQLRVAADSLVRFGGYDGPVLVIGDQPADVVRGLLPPGLRDKLAVRHVPGGDAADYQGARMLLGELPEALDRQPVIYADTDVVFDAPILPILRRLALQRSMTAQQEERSPLPHAGPTGGALFAEDPAPVAGLNGFNSGLLGFPNLREHGRVLRASRRALTAHAALFGRDDPWADQPMINYIARKLEAFDPTLFSAVVRVPPRPSVLPDTAGAAGLVHFWPYAADAWERARGMQAYCNDLAAHLARPGPWSAGT
jgi:hypothetical protein